MDIGTVKEVGDRPPEPLVIPKETPEPEFTPRRNDPDRTIPNPERERELVPVKE